MMTDEDAKQMIAWHGCSVDLVKDAYARGAADEREFIKRLLEQHIEEPMVIRATSLRESFRESAMLDAIAIIDTHRKQ
jgi:hypothetical protein